MFLAQFYLIILCVQMQYLTVSWTLFLWTLLREEQSMYKVKHLANGKSVGLVGLQILRSHWNEQWVESQEEMPKFPSRDFHSVWSVKCKPWSLDYWTSIVLWSFINLAVCQIHMHIWTWLFKSDVLESNSMNNFSWIISGQKFDLKSTGEKIIVWKALRQSLDFFHPLLP